ncbi:MAG TPA: hypothetical protein VGZ29_06855 [Terriglobia bacterium]|nr:hypothetical protein [Terriglobia bacterium]
MRFRVWPRLLTFAVLCGLAFVGEGPLSGQGAAASDLPGSTLPLGTVTVLGSASCPGGAATGAKCTEITVSCPGLPNLNAILGVAVPTAKPVGTIVLHNGGTGVDFFNDGFPDVYLGDGFNVVQIAWASDWANANNAGVKSAACRPATVFNYAFKTVQHSSRTIGFCGQGLSGGGATLGYALAHYGLSSEFDYVVIGSGPSVSRMDYGCDPPLYKGPALDLCPLDTNAVFDYGAGAFALVNTWEGTTTCGTSNPPQSDINKWAADSIVSAGANYTYPKTAVSWFFCVTRPGLVTGQGEFLIEQVVPRNDPPDVNCYTGTCSGEAVWQDPNAFNLAVSEMLSQCQPNH